MARYMVLGFGGTAPETDEDVNAMNERWMAWFAKAGDAVIDNGSPFGASATAGALDRGCGAMGYFMVQAETLDEAVKLASASPAVGDGGGIEVFEVVHG